MNHHLTGKTATRAVVAVFFTCFFGLLFATAPVSATSIKDIAGSPREYVGDELRLRGEVISAHKVPLIDTWLLAVYDGTATIIVITGEQRETGDRFRARVKILGIATDGAEEASEEIARSIADFLVDRQITERNRARRGADSVVTFLRTVLPFLDTSLCAVELE